MIASHHCLFRKVHESIVYLSESAFHSLMASSFHCYFPSVNIAPLSPVVLTFLHLSVSTTIEKIPNVLMRQFVGLIVIGEGQID